MIGDVINIEERHLDTAKNILAVIQEKGLTSGGKKIAIGIGGESGSGKSVTAYALQKVLQDLGLESIVLQMDDYFHLPPRSNHENRVKSLENVGVHEVNLEKLSENIKAFRNGETSIEKPLVHYQENKILSESMDTKDFPFLIIEGTYILDIDDFDFKIFIDRNYKDTYENRMNRNRDEKSDFVEQVLDIEHKIIKQYKDKADLVLGKNYQIISK